MRVWFKIVTWNRNKFLCKVDCSQKHFSHKSLTTLSSNQICPNADVRFLEVFPPVLPAPFCLKFSTAKSTTHLLHVIFHFIDCHHYLILSALFQTEVLVGSISPCTETILYFSWSLHFPVSLTSSQDGVKAQYWWWNFSIVQRKESKRALHLTGLDFVCPRLVRISSL